MKKYLAEVKKRADAATPGPLLLEDWLDTEEQEVYVQSRTIGTVAVCQNMEDGEFIAHARTDIPLLLAIIEEQVDLIEDLAQPNKMSETEATLLHRFELLRGRARKLVASSATGSPDVSPKSEEET